MGPNNEKWELFKKIYKLERIKENLKDKDPKKVEASLYAKVGCRSQRERIKFTVKYVLTKLNNDESSYKQHPDYPEDIKILNIILDFPEEKITPKVIKSMKKYIVFIELKYEIPIGFVSIVDALLVELKERLRNITDQD